MAARRSCEFLKKKGPGLRPETSGGSRAGNRPNGRREIPGRAHGALPSRRARGGKDPEHMRQAARSTLHKTAERRKAHGAARERLARETGILVHALDEILR